MPLVDRDDHSLQRYVVWHYRHDPSRNERRNVILDAYGNEVEFVDAVRRLIEELDQRKVALVETVRWSSLVVSSVRACPCDWWR